MTIKIPIKPASQVCKLLYFDCDVLTEEKVPAALVIERDVVLRNVVRSALVSQGFEVLDAANAAEACKLCETLREPLDLLIVDHAVLGASAIHDGPPLVSVILHGSPGAKVLVISECPPVGLAGGSLIPGAWFLQKPFTATQLVEMVSNILKPRIQ